MRRLRLGCCRATHCCGRLFRYWEPRAGHSLADAAFLDEVLFHPADLPVEQVVGLVDQADGDVGHDLGGAGLAELAKSS